MTPTERQERITAIRELPAALEAAVAGLSGEQLDTPYREGGWTIRQVVHHVADSHMNAFIRMKLILTENVPTLKPYDQDDWARLPDVARASLGSSLTLLKGLHERWAALLEELPDQAWERKAFHPERGEVTLEGQLAVYAEHGRKHTGQITGLRKDRGW